MKKILLYLLLIGCLIPVYAVNETTEVCETTQASGPITFRRTQIMKCRNTDAIIQEIHFFKDKTVTMYNNLGKNLYPKDNLEWDMSDGRIRIYRDGYEHQTGTYQISNGELAWVVIFGDKYYPAR